MKFYILLLTTLLFSITNSQVLFFEDFQDEANNSTIGTDSTGVNWSISTPYTSNGFFKIKNNKLVVKHTRGQATLETDNINIPSANNVLININLKENYSLESSGCVADYIKFEYSWNNGNTWEAIGDTIYGTITNDILETDCINEVDTIRGPFLTLGSFPSHSSSIYIPVNGTSLKLRLIIKTFWVDEKHIIDNFKVSL